MHTISHLENAILIEYPAKTTIGNIFNFSDYVQAWAHMYTPNEWAFCMAKGKWGGGGVFAAVCRMLPPSNDMMNDIPFECNVMSLVYLCIYNMYLYVIFH